MRNEINNHIVDMIFIQKTEMIANKLNIKKDIHPDWIILDRNKIKEIGNEN